jgi:hypothetical protein
MTATRLHSPAAERNREPLLEGLRALLPDAGTAIEIASGSGQHAAWFAEHLPAWTWWPTDLDARVLPSIDAWCAGLPAVQPARVLDVLQPDWAGLPTGVGLVFCANMLHIAPWPCCAGLMRGAARHLAADGVLVTYGPYLVPGEPTAPSNLAFDADLRQRDPAWGLRDLDAIVAEAQAAGLAFAGQRVLPANNRMLWFRLATKS